MSQWTPRRFWSAASVVPAEGGFAVQLDSKPVRTPLKAPLVVPTEALAREIAAEWQAVEGKVDPSRMPLTRMANSAIDKVAPQFDAIAAMLAEYGGSDLVCYRTDDPEELAARQATAWDPLLDWAAEALGAPLIATIGVMHRAQPEASLDSLHQAVRALDAFQLSAFHDLVALSGSLVIALALIRDRIEPEEAWRLGRIDEVWQIEQWGEDEEAADLVAFKREEFLRAHRFLRLCR